MNGRKTATLLPIIAALAIVALTLYAYRGLPARLFAADDYQWLLGVQGLGFGALVRRAFDPTAQTHFYRPLIWLLFWAQTRAFGLDPRGFHAVSLALHLLNAALLGALAYRLTPKLKMENAELRSRAPFSIFNSQFSIPLLAMAIVALHPAPFEAVVWISAQSELLAAALLLLALHLWLPRQADKQRSGEAERMSSLPAFVSPRLLASTLALGLALLAKESAVIGLPLLVLLGSAAGASSQEPEASDSHPPSPISHLRSPILAYLLPTLVTLAYLALQIMIERRNYLLEQGGYGLGIQVVLNPLRSLALLVAPLPGTEHADAPWLVPLGGLVALLILVWAIYHWRSQSTIYNLQSAIVVALALILLPTAPFASPPDSRYLYLPVMAGALLPGFWIYDLRFWITSGQSKIQNHKSKMGWLVTGLLVLALAGWAAGELHAREGRFAAASGPGGSLWQVAAWACQASRPERVAIVDPPLAAPHAEAIVGLACGADVRAKIVGADQVAGAIKGRTLVLAFPNGSAEVQRWP
jgi:hypothetical protein